jgi:putative tricarboxylic transport membrane protein
MIFPMPPLILAFVLGGLMEENLRRSLLLSDGSGLFYGIELLQPVY